MAGYRSVLLKMKHFNSHSQSLKRALYTNLPPAWLLSFYKRNQTTQEPKQDQELIVPA